MVPDGDSNDSTPEPTAAPEPSATPTVFPAPDVPTSTVTSTVVLAPALPPPDANQIVKPTRQPEPGDLTPGWHKVTLLLWILVLLAMAAVWSTSVQLGLATWWLGPRGDRNSVFIQLLPFVPPLAMQIITLLGVRWTALYGLVASATLAVIGLFDLSKVTGLGVTGLGWLEITIAGAALLVSVASLTGTYRRARA